MATGTGVRNSNGPAEREGSQTLPGLRGVDHIGITVPDLDEAIGFFVEVLGCEPFYELGPFTDDDGWLKQHLNVPAGTVMKKLKFLRCGNGSNLEVFQYETENQAPKPPLNSDIGGHHLAFYVDDFDAAVAFLRRSGVRVLGAPVVRDSGPSAGQTWIYFLTPWDLQCELVSFPDGKGYERQTRRRLWETRGRQTD